MQCSKAKTWSVYLESKGAFQAKQINTALVLHVLELLQDEIKVGKGKYKTHFINYFLFQYWIFHFI